MSKQILELFECNSQMRSLSLNEAKSEIPSIPCEVGESSKADGKSSGDESSKGVESESASGDAASKSGLH